MKQPVLGVVSSVLVMAVALGFISLFDFGGFAGWVSFVALCFIPMEIVAGIIWGANPPFVAGLRQPAKGAVLVLATAVVAAIVAPLVFHTIGEGVPPPGPIPSHFTIIAVVFTFWLAIMLGGWPFTSAIGNPVAAGAAVLVAAYLVTYTAFRLLFNYDFMRDAPVFLATAPQGFFAAVPVLVFCVTHVAAMFVVLCFDLWPFTTSPAVMKQPVLGIVWTVLTLALTACAMYIGVGLVGADPMIFLTRVTVPFIFGAILVLNMFENSLTASLAQPLKGVANVAVAVFFGVGLSKVYGLLVPTVTGTLPSGAPGYEFEIWLANALLGITFPLLVCHAVYFGFWPFARREQKS